MASQDDHAEHLDAAAGREVVYCHACSHEWYRDDYGLMCPCCTSEVTEIVSPENDPRRVVDSSSSASSTRAPLPYADDSDPDEADIDDFTGPHGFHFRRSTRVGPDDTHHDPSINPVFQRFHEMVQDFGQPRRNETTGLFNRPNNTNTPGQRVFRTTYTSGPFGGATASVTIFTSPDFGSRGSGGDGGAGAGTGTGDEEEPFMRGDIDPFQVIFSNVIRDMAPAAEGGDGGLRLFRNLQEILSHFNPANAMMGDAVYSQEALDRIISELMESQSHPNAPGVSEEAIAKLERKTVDKDFLGPDGKVECSICLDAMELSREESYVGKVVTFLPCKHWFHDECAVPWLKEHNSCPICRTPIEKPGAPQENNRRESTTGDAGASGQNNNRNSPSQSQGSSSRPDRADTPMSRAAAEMVSSVNLSPQPQPSNPVHTRLNETLRNASNIQGDHGRRNRTTTSAFSYDTSRLQRRTSHSPPSPRAADLAEQGARMRQRSPSESERRGSRPREAPRQSGALNWLRERFAGGGGFGTGGNQGESGDGRQT